MRSPLVDILCAPLPAPAVPSGGDDSVASSVRAVLLGGRGELRAVERRQLPRFPYPYPVHLTPLDSADRPILDETIVVVGKLISEQGLDFYYRDPIAFRRAIASLELDGSRWIGLLLDLTWTRFSRHGWYENGGRFLAVCDSPLGA